MNVLPKYYIWKSIEISMIVNLAAYIFSFNLKKWISSSNQPRLHSGFCHNGKCNPTITMVSWEIYFYEWNKEREIHLNEIRSTSILPQLIMDCSYSVERRIALCNKIRHLVFSCDAEVCDSSWVFIKINFVKLDKNGFYN